MSVEILEQTAGFGKDENSVLTVKWLTNRPGREGRMEGGGVPLRETKTNERFLALGAPSLVSFTAPW